MQYIRAGVIRGSDFTHFRHQIKYLSSIQGIRSLNFVTIKLLQ